MAFQIVSAAIAVFALCLSGLALYRQRAHPRVDGQLLWDAEGFAAVSVTNTGTSPAKAPWFLVATGNGQGVAAHVGTHGFLGVGETSTAISAIPTAMLRKGAARGVVGCIDGSGRYVVWDSNGDRPKRKKKITFEEGFRLFHPDVDLGEQFPIRRLV